MLQTERPLCKSATMAPKNLARPTSAGDHKPTFKEISRENREASVDTAGTTQVGRTHLHDICKSLCLLRVEVVKTSITGHF